ncbi:MAG: ABC transporter substrate-binding protein [Acidimicrobiia bacterium]|nr:ABC transporter substrate-binding protein [Acidimicrobiia bacterium]
MRHTRWVALVVTIVLVTAGTTAVAFAQGSGDKPTATEVGITDKEIRVAVIADVDNAIAPGLFQGSVSGVQGWAKFVNANGGLAGRKVKVDFIDSKLNPDEARNATIKACSEDFAIVGTTALFLNNVDDIEACVDKAGAAVGLPDIAVLAQETVQQCSPTTYSINPSNLVCSTKDQHPQTYRANSGRAFYYEKKFGKDLHGAYIFGSDIKAAENGNRGSMTQMQEAGSGIKQDFEATISARALQAAYAPIVQQLKDDSSNYAQSGSSFNSTVLLRKEAKLQGVTDPKFIWDCTLQCYDSRLLEQGGADVEGQYISTLFLPFEEASSNKTLANFLKYTGKDKADGFGAQAYASGLLFSQAVDQIVKADGVNGITRQALFDQLATINDFDAGGMIATTNIADHRPSNCYVLTQVKSGKFVRVNPSKKGTFDCQARNIVEIKLDLIK